MVPRAGFPRLSRITAKSKGRWGGAGGIQERGLCLGEFYSLPASHLELRTPHRREPKTTPQWTLGKRTRVKPILQEHFISEKHRGAKKERQGKKAPRSFWPITPFTSTWGFAYLGLTDYTPVTASWALHGSRHRVCSKTFENIPQPWGRKRRNKTSGSRRYSVQFKYDPELWRGDIQMRLTFDDMPVGVFQT